MYLLTKPTQSSKLLIKLAFQRLLGYHITQKIHLMDKAEDCCESMTTAQGREDEISSEATRCSGTIPKTKRRTWWLSEWRREHLHCQQRNIGHRNALAGKDACCQDSSEFDPQSPHNTELTLESLFSDLYVCDTQTFFKRVLTGAG